MGERRFTVTTDVPVGAGVALDFLADLPRHHGLHPFLVSAAVVAEGAGWQVWEVVERPTAGPVRYRIRFRAELARSLPDELHSTVRLPPCVRLDSHTVATDRPGGARLVETTRVVAPGPLLGYVARSAERAHTRTFGLLPGELASG